MMRTLSRFLLLLFLGLSAIAVQAQDKPRWAIKGLGNLNEKRTNQTYQFVKFETFGGDLAQLRNESTRPLVEYLASTFHLDADNASVENLGSVDTHIALPNDPEGSSKVQHDYKVTFSGNPSEVFYARLVDEYSSFDENVDLTYDYTLYQLFAVSTTPGEKPVYDDYSFSRSYNAKALALSIVPGLGQWYKGQTTKAYCIWGGEVVFAACAIACEARRAHFQDLRDKAYKEGNMISHDSYDSKTSSYRVFRNIALAGVIGVYVYNLADALLSKGPRQVIVKKPSGVSLAMQPSLIYEPASSFGAPAVGVTLTF